MCGPVLSLLGGLIATKKASSASTPTPAPAPEVQAPPDPPPNPVDQGDTADAAMAAKDKRKKQEKAAMNWFSTKTSGSQGVTGAAPTKKNVLLGGVNTPLGQG